jgi:hypothetical protein
MTYAWRIFGSTFGLLLLLVTAAADAQSPPGGRARQRSTDAPRAKADNGAPRANPAADPIAAIQRELPSLKVDLKVSAEQLPAWNAFTVSVRVVHDISLASAKRELAARAAPDAPRAESLTTDPPSALLFVATLVDEERQRAAAMGEMQVALKALVEVLSADQRKMFDRRIALAQREPLGIS